MIGRTIGIIGGGQLGRMLTLAAKPMGFDVVVVDPSPNCPAAQVGAREITAELYDPVALAQLADQADFITVEIEHFDAGVLEGIASLGKPVNPAPATIKIIQDKLWQKQLLQVAGIPIARFREISSGVDARNALNDFNGEMIIKTRKGGYDGRGNIVVKSEEEAKDALKQFGKQPVYAEELIPFKKELAALVAKSINGEVAVYPIVQTVHKRNICIKVLAPAPIRRKDRKAAVALAKKTAELLRGAGVFAIEMFLTEDGKVLVNEIAPRVHNSGHFTIEACHTSQFEQHIRAISGLPLGSSELVVPAAVMINLLGERDGPTDLKGLDNALSTPHTSVHIYGKSPTKVDRKMGHVTSTGSNLREAKRRAKKAHKKIKI